MQILSLIVFALFFGSCNSEDELVLSQPELPGEVSIASTVSTDGSGLVSLSAQASNAMVYHFYFGIGAAEVPTVSYSGEIDYTYRASGDYTVRVVAYGEGGIASASSTEIAVEVDFKPPADVLAILTNGSSRNWIWKQDVVGHLGVGPEFYDDGTIGDLPIWYQSAPNEKAGEGCLYEDVITFTAVDEATVQMTIANNGSTYFNLNETQDAIGEPAPSVDSCFPYDVSGISTVSFFDTGSGISGSTQIGMDINGGAFFSYFIGATQYEILSISETELWVRGIQDINGFRLAWYQKFIAEDADMGTEPGELELVWADEFETPGAPDDTKWTYDLGDGCPGNCGWGNNEDQFYTSDAANVIVEGGVLKITAIRESVGGKSFTSARLKTQGLFAFTEGRIDVRAKVPAGGGTWPAAWMLGSDITSVGWPACGEIDILEYKGNESSTIYGTTHTPSGFGGTAIGGTTTLATANSEFHVYSAIWTAESIEFLVDDVVYFTYNPTTKNQETYPFDNDFFILLNLAMGGTFGGTIDPAVNQAVYEVDYVRVYQ